MSLSTRFLCALALMLTLGCTPESTPAEPRFGVLNEHFPLHLRGWDGFEFELEAPPEHIIPMNATGVDVLSVLVQPSRAAALPETALQYSTFDSEREDWLKLQRFEEISTVELLGYKPDFVIGHEWQGASAVPYLRQAGVPVLIFPMPDTWEDVCEELAVLGTVLGEPQRAKDLLDDLERRRLALQASASKRRHLRILGYSNYGTGGWAAGAGTTVDLVIALAGMQNAARDAGLENFQEIDYEQLLGLDPDMILVEVEADDQVGPTESLLRSERILGGLSALEKHGIARLPRRLNSTTSFRMMEAAERLADIADRWIEAQQ